MTLNGWLQILFYAVLLFALTKPLGVYMVRVYDGSMGWLGWLERPIYRICGVDPNEDQHWTRYAGGLLLFSLASMLLTYLVLRLQAMLPFNPAHLPAVTDRQSFETAASFTTNTNWQSYGGETTMSYFSQMTQLTFHNFTSAAAGMAALIALIRGVARHGGEAKGRVGNFWTDLVRGTLYVLLPLSLIVALAPRAAGRHPESQRLRANHHARRREAGARHGSGGKPDRDQTDRYERRRIFQRELGASVRERDAVVELHRDVLDLALAAGLTWTYGRMVKRQAHGWALWAAMFVLFAAGDDNDLLV